MLRAGLGLRSWGWRWCDRQLRSTRAPAIYQPYVAFDAAGNVYAAGGSVQSSPDGNVWTDITTSGGTTVPVSGTPATYVGAFTVGGSNVVFVGAGGKQGLWRRSGGMWKVSFDTPSRVLSMAQDPSQPTTLYVGVEDGGMYRSLSGGE